MKNKQDGRLYVGSTSGLARRLQEHKDGVCESTKHRRPLTLEAYVAVKEESIARNLETYLKI